MKRDVKGPSAMHARPSSFLSLVTGWVQQGVESFLATQRIIIDLAMKRNVSAMNTLRESLSDPEHSPQAILTEVAVEGTANFIEAQRILLNLVQEENEIVMKGMKERAGGYTRVMAITDVLRRSIDTVVEMQQDFLTTVNKQTQTWIQPTRTGKGYDTQLTELAREAMDNFVRAQKKFLDVIAEETDKAIGDHDRTPKMMKKTELSKLARDAANSLIEAQKKLLDLAGHQIDVNREAVSRTKDLLTPFQILPVSEFTSKGVKGFIDAEKEMIENMQEEASQVVKAATSKPPKVAKTAKRPRRKTRKARAKAATA